MKERFVFKSKTTINLNEFLRNELPSKIDSKEISNSKIRRLITAGCVFVNGKNIVRPGFELRGTSNVVVEFDKEKFFYEKQPDDIQFTVTDTDVLYENDSLIFINKPSFFPVEQTITGNRANLHDAVVDYLHKRNPKLRNDPYVGIMHRLDRETSGVILFTKTRAINKAVSDMFQSHSFKKLYTAVVAPSRVLKIPGVKQLKSGVKFVIEKYMGRISSKSQAGKWGSVPESKGGVYSKTTFEIEKECVIKGKKCFVVNCDLETGRTHQIRVHLSEAGLPILGDVLYGGFPYERLMLHARALEIHNSDVGVDGTIEAKIPWEI